ncbi:hypothetical protein ACFRCG_41645 [Embleya sp. NPDC056575]|uniref:hypothetical protein n=1 Tax=unclassified Embleya TaxID=2699296 RepID=UPI003688DD48
MIRLITTGRLADLEEVTMERDAHAAESRQRGCDAAKWAGLYEQTIAERDQARAIAVDFEQGLAAQADVVTGLRATIAARLESTQRMGAEYDVRIATLTADRDRALAQAETARAAAEAADIPIVDGLDPDDYRAAVKAVLADIAARKKVAADLRALTETDPEAACRAGEAMADWAARPEAL